MIRAVIFDCFGVLITDALSAIVAEMYQINPDGADQIRQLVNLSNRGVIDADESTRQVSIILDITVDEYRNRIKDGEIRNTALFEFILSLRPRYKTALLSNISIGGLLRRFPARELSTYFDVAVASSEVGYAKPDAEAYLITAKKLGVEPAECVFVDDREDYCRGAEAIGMKAIEYINVSDLKARLEPLLAL